MGGEGSADAAPRFRPKAAPIPVPRALKSIACNDESVLLITDSPILELRAFSGAITTKPVSLTPTCVCAASGPVWIVGFASGTITEFDANLQLLFSYRKPGECRAHDAAVTHLLPADDSRQLAVHLTSLGLDNVVKFWSADGLLIHTFSPSSPVLHLSSAGYLAFICTGPNSIESIDLKDPEFRRIAFSVPAPVKFLTLIADGLAAIAVLEDHSICVLSASEVILQFKNLQTDTVVAVLPLNLEGGTGLITYATLDQLGKVTLRAVKTTLEEVEVVGKLGLLAESRLSVVVQQDKNVVVYDRDQLTMRSMELLVELPQEPKLKNFFTRIGVP
jgi:hypothetical protein